MIALFLTVDKNICSEMNELCPSLSMDSMNRMVITTLKYSKELPKRKQCKTRLNVEKLRDASCTGYENEDIG